MIAGGEGDDGAQAGVGCLGGEQAIAGAAELERAGDLQRFRLDQQAEAQALADQRKVEQRRDDGAAAKAFGGGFDVDDGRSQGRSPGRSMGPEFDGC